MPARDWILVTAPPFLCATVTTTWPALQRQWEQGRLAGKRDDERDDAGGKVSGRSGRQLLGHCLPGVCTSVISQPLSSLAGSGRVPRFSPPATQIPSLHLPPTPASAMPRNSGAGQILWASKFIYRHSDLVAASLSRFLSTCWWTMSDGTATEMTRWGEIETVCWMCRQRSYQNSVLS